MSPPNALLRTLTLSPSVPTSLEQCFEDVGGQVQKVVHIPSAKGRSQTMIKEDSTTCGTLHPSFEGNPDVIDAPQVSLVRESCSGFCHL